MRASPAQSNSPFNTTEPNGGIHPPIPGPQMLEVLMDPSRGTLKTGIVTDVWTHNLSCTILVLNEGSGPGTPCIWGEPTIGRFGGVSDVSPPQPGSAILAFIPPSSGYGFVICSIPSLKGDDPEAEMRVFLDSLTPVTSSTDDTGASPDATGATSLSMAAASENTPSDIFPGDRAFVNQLGMAIALLGYRALFKASELSKVEAFVQDDLVRITSHAFDHWTSRSERGLREDSDGNTIEYELSGELGPKTRKGIWGALSLMGLAGDGRRDFRIAAKKNSTEGEEEDEDSAEGDDQPPKGVSEQYFDSSGVALNRSVVMSGIVKTPVIRVPMPVSDALPGDSTHTSSDPDKDGLVDFNWGENGDLQLQIRDMLAWVMNRQANAQNKILGSAMSSPGSSEESAMGIPSGVPRSSGFNRADPQIVETRTDSKKTRKVAIGDAWALVLPDGSVSIRDLWGSSITMSHGNITISPSNDLILRPGRNLVCKPGHDAIIAPKKHVDISAADGQTRVWGKKGVMVHGEDGGVMVSSHADDAGTNPESTTGEAFVPAGIVLKTEGTITTHADTVMAHAGRAWVVSGRDEDTPPAVAINSTTTVLNYQQSIIAADVASSKAVQVSAYGIELDGDLVTNDGNVLAPKGQVLCDTLLNSSGEVSKRDKAREKDKKPLWERLQKVIESAAKVFGFYPFEKAKWLEFSFRTEKSYGPRPVLLEQPWEREWDQTERWGEDAVSQGPKSGRKTWAWPGKSGWKGNASYRKYKEVNVNDIGFPVDDLEMESSPPDPEMASLRDMRIHP